MGAAETVHFRSLSGELLNVRTVREWQKYRGCKIRILGELEHSGGMTTREISTRIGYTSHATSNRLVELQRSGFVERIERWGWRITGDGIFLLNLNYTTTTPQQHHNNTTTTPRLDKEEPAPSCFDLTTCHIKKNTVSKRYTSKTMVLCNGCIWEKPGHWITPRAPVEIKVVGGTIQRTLPEE